MLTPIWLRNIWKKAGRKLGVNVYVEKQGANGIEGRLTADQLNSATACIFAAEVAIKESERFNGIPALSVPVAEPIRHAEALIQQALTLKRSDETRTVQQDTQPVKSVKTELKQALLSGISFAVPLIVAGGGHGAGGRGITVANLRATRSV